jgi:type I restriction enzyme R subunit
MSTPVSTQNATQSVLRSSGSPARLRFAAVSGKIAAAFTELPEWRRSEKQLRELRKKVTSAVYAEEDDLTKVTASVDGFFGVLQQGHAK